MSNHLHRVPAATLVAVVAPLAAGSTPSDDVTTVTIEITDAGCPAPQQSYDSGSFSFAVENVSAVGVTEFEVLEGNRILGEKENLPPGFSGTFSLNLGPGTCTLYCPGADKRAQRDHRHRRATHRAADRYRGDPPPGRRGLPRLCAHPGHRAVDGGRGARRGGQDRRRRRQQACLHPGPALLRADRAGRESFVLGDRNLDAAIDLRADDVEPTELEGFHRIEYGLWVEQSVEGLAEVSTQLVADVASLQGLVEGLDSLQPYDLANGAVGLLDEAACCKITGEEERYSRIDLLDMAANVEGSQQAFAYLEPGLAEIDPDLVATITERFYALWAAVDDLADEDEASGFLLYDSLTDEQITGLSDALQAVAEPLSQVAEKVITE